MSRFVILTLTDRGYGGIQRATSAVVAALDRTYGEGSSSSVVASPSGATNRRAKLHFVARVLREITVRRARAPRTVICMHVRLAVPALLIARARRSTLLVVLHGREAWNRLNPSTRWSVRRADAVIAPSEFTARRFELSNGTLPRPIRVVSWPVELPPSLNPNERRRDQVLCVARLTRESAYKGVDTLLEAWRRVIMSRPSARLRIVGDGDDRARLEELAACILGGARDSVTFLGNLSAIELDAEYRSAQVFVLPTRARDGDASEGEGYGIVFAEAAAYSLPAVAGDSGGVAEVVKDRKTGWIVKGDDPLVVATQMLVVLDDEDLLTRTGAAARQHAMDAFSPESFRSKLAGVCEDIGG